MNARVQSDWKRQEVQVPGLIKPISHYVDMVVAGPLIFVSGMVGVDGEGALVGEDVVSQARRVHECLSEALATIGLDFSHVAKVVVYLTDVNDRSAIDEVRKEFFGQYRPASTLVEISALAIPGAKVEIEAYAVDTSVN